MICPKCGSAMNHHADKVEYLDGTTSDSNLGSVVKEVHTCPGCGNVETQASAS